MLILRYFTQSIIQVLFLFVMGLIGSGYKFCVKGQSGIISRNLSSKDLNPFILVEVETSASDIPA